MRLSRPMARSVVSGAAIFLANFGVPRPRIRSTCVFTHELGLDAEAKRHILAKPPGGFIFHIEPFPDIREVLR